MSHLRPTPSPQGGFTLIELLVAVVIAAVLLVAGAPSFFGAVERNRIVSQANDVNAAFSFARSEALRRNVPLNICRLNATEDGCAASTGPWEGWLVWADLDRSGSFDAGEELRLGTISGRDSLAVADTGGTAVLNIRLDQRGRRAEPANNVLLTLKPAECEANRPLVRRFQLTASGSLSLQCIKCGTENETEPDLCD